MKISHESIQSSFESSLPENSEHSIHSWIYYPANNIVETYLFFQSSTSDALPSIEPILGALFKCMIRCKIIVPAGVHVLSKQISTSPPLLTENQRKTYLTPITNSKILPSSFVFEGNTYLILKNDWIRIMITKNRNFYSGIVYVNEA